MNWIDVAFILIVFVSAFVGLVRGFVREVFSVLTWIAAIWASLHFSEEFTTRLPEAIPDETLRLIIAFVLIFIGVLIVGGIVGVLARRLVQGVGLRGIDGSLGILFGILRGTVVVLLVVFLVDLLGMKEENAWQESRLVPQAEEWLLWTLEQLPASLQESVQQLQGNAEQTLQ